MLDYQVHTLFETTPPSDIGVPIPAMQMGAAIDADLA